MQDPAQHVSWQSAFESKQWQARRTRFQPPRRGRGRQPIIFQNCVEESEHRPESRTGSERAARTVDEAHGAQADSGTETEQGGADSSASGSVARRPCWPAMRGRQAAGRSQQRRGRVLPPKSAKEAAARCPAEGAVRSNNPRSQPKAISQYHSRG